MKLCGDLERPRLAGWSWFNCQVINLAPRTETRAGVTRSRPLTHYAQKDKTCRTAKNSALVGKVERERKREQTRIWVQWLSVSIIVRCDSSIPFNSLQPTTLQTKSYQPTMFSPHNLSNEYLFSTAGLESQCTQQQRLQLQASQSALQSALQQQVVVMINPDHTTPSTFLPLHFYHLSPHTSCP